MGRKRLLIGLIAVVVLAAVVIASVKARRGDQVAVQTGKVDRVDELISKVNASGEIKPKEYVELQAEISGVITELYVKEGDYVDKGDLLLKIDPAQTEAETRAQQALLEVAVLDASNQNAQINLQGANLSRERANVRAAEAEVDRTKQAHEFAANNFLRKQELFEQNLVSRDFYEAAKNDEVAAKSALDSAHARLEQAKAGQLVAEMTVDQAKNSYAAALSRVEQNRAILERTRDTLSKTAIRSPLTGVITQLNVEVGERAVPGTLNNPSATIMIIADLSIIEAEIEVDETDIVRVMLGQEAEVKVDALVDQPLKGVVTEIGNSAIQKVGQQQEAKDFKVAIRLEEPPKSLRPGLSCTADITTATRQSVLTVPIQALTVRELDVDPEGKPILPDPRKKEPPEPSDPDRKKAKKEEFEGVFVVNNGKAEFVNVQTGITGDTEIEIEEGLDEGDVIVTGSYKALRSLNHGDQVKIEPKTGA